MIEDIVMDNEIKKYLWYTFTTNSDTFYISNLTLAIVDISIDILFQRENPQLHTIKSIILSKEQAILNLSNQNKVIREICRKRINDLKPKIDHQGKQYSGWNVFLEIVEKYLK